MTSFLRLQDQSAPLLGSPISFESLKSNPVDTHAIGQSTRQTSQSGLSLLFRDGIPAEAIQSRSRAWSLSGKRVFDVICASSALALLMPLFAAVAVCIVATSNGPVFFSQPREGLHGRSFLTLKFRSMRVEKGDPTGVAQTTRDDPRLTKIGKFIRRTSIDELPQLFNVLRGDMSLVGPRPHVAEMRAGGTLYKELVPYYDARLAMRPGITGWAQANGYRGPTVEAGRAYARVDHDIAYIQNWSFLLDLKIIFLTVKSEFLNGSGS